MVHAGEAVIAVRVFDHYGDGGFSGNKKQMQLKLTADPIHENIN